MDRRSFMKVAAASSLLATTGTAEQAEARHNLEPLPEALGLLYDSSLCIGCQSCVAKCQQVNKMEHNPVDAAHSANDRLNPYTFNVIQVWKNGTGEHKDQVKDGYAYIKRQCMHCVDPNCVSACPVSAMQKDPVTGIVTTDPNLCTGCRYCMVACPFGVPQYAYHDPFGRLAKCSLCNQKEIKRLDKGGIPGCAEVCPTGAVIFGKRNELLREARRRISAKTGEEYDYPVRTLDSGDTNTVRLPHYLQEIYGEREGGGTQCLILSTVPYKNFALPELEERSFGSKTETVQHGLYKGMFLPIAFLPAVLFGWLAFRTKAHIDGEHGDEEHGEQNRLEEEQV